MGYEGRGMGYILHSYAETGEWLLVTRQGERTNQDKSGQNGTFASVHREVFALMTDARRDSILALITEKGPQGVSNISRALDIPLTTLQKYLHKQTYFRLNDDKRWDLPQNVEIDLQSSTLSLMTAVARNSILLAQAQLEETLNTLKNSIEPLNSLERSVSAIKPSSVIHHPVAKESSGEVSKEWAHIYSEIGRVPSIIKAKKEHFTQEHLELLLNVRWHDMVLEIGTKAFATASNAVADVALGESDTIPDDVIDLLSEYLKES